MSGERGYETPAANAPAPPPAIRPQLSGRRPILAWVLYLLHLWLIPWVIWYVAAAFHLIPVDDQMAQALAQHSWLSKFSSVAVPALLLVGVHRLFFRQSRALFIYLCAPAFYLLQNVAIFGKYCLHYSCPPITFFVSVATNVLIMLAGAYFIAITLKRWPPRDRQRHEA